MKRKRKKERKKKTFFSQKERKGKHRRNGGEFMHFFSVSLSRSNHVLYTLYLLPLLLFYLLSSWSYSISKDESKREGEQEFIRAVACDIENETGEIGSRQLVFSCLLCMSFVHLEQCSKNYVSPAGMTLRVYWGATGSLKLFLLLVYILHSTPTATTWIRVEGLK